MKNQNVFPLERNRYFYGKLLTVRDFEVEQTYMNNKRRILNRAVTGTGVVCGLSVQRSDDVTLMIVSGLALDYAGREIVVESPIIKKLQMIDGYGALMGRTEAFLSIRFSEQEAEKVNAVGADASQSIQNNKFIETYALALETAEPDVASILDVTGRCATTLLYSANGVRVALSVPVCAPAGEEFILECRVLNSADSEPLSSDISFESDCAVSLSGEKRIQLSFTEGAGESGELYTKQFKVRAASLADMTARFAVTPVQFDLRMGDLNDGTSVTVEDEIFIARSKEDCDAYLERRDTFERRMKGSDLPIYLAKLDLIPMGAASIIRKVQPLPFGQRLHVGGEGGGMGGSGVLNVTSEVRTLKYWQKPEAYADYNGATGTLNFKFGIPSTEAYDYATSSGIVDIPLTGGLRVNARYFSEEVPHNLGPGNVNITLSVEFQEEEQPRLYYGNCEVFRGKNGNKAVPQVQTGAILYPERGTFKVGVWLLDNVEGTSIRVRYFASKAARDVDDFKRKNQVSIKVLPEIQRVRVRERLRLKAIVSGTEDRGVLWSVKDTDGGSIDRNGLYQAPATRGTYEIVVQSTADPECKISTFVIVEE